MFLPLWGIHSGLALETEKKDVFSSRKGKNFVWKVNFEDYTPFPP